MHIFLTFLLKMITILTSKKDGRFSKPNCQAGSVSMFRWRTAVSIYKIGAKVRYFFHTSRYIVLFL